MLHLHGHYGPETSHALVDAHILEVCRANKHGVCCFQTVLMVNQSEPTQNWYRAKSVEHCQSLTRVCSHVKASTCFDALNEC